MVGVALVAEARAAGLVLQAGPDGRLIVRGPVSAEPLVRRLLEHKAAVLLALAPTPDMAPTADDCKPVAIKPVCRCGSATTIDVRIHDGQSTRRDCGRCGRFLMFVRWYGDALEQQP